MPPWRPSISLRRMWPHSSDPTGGWPAVLPLFRLRRERIHASWFLPPSAAAPRGPVPSSPLPDVDFGLSGE